VRLFEALILGGLVVTCASSAIGIVAMANLYKQNIQRTIDWCSGAMAAGCALMIIGVLIAPK